ncbi:MAG: radical SAM protein [Acetobacteraceae bacterium]|nr:radical SAM protein [Acetobacteraceae bacterium]
MEAVVSLADLTSVTVVVTRNCNLRCRWCFEDSAPGCDRQEPEFPSLVRIFERVAGRGRHITFTGGEPFARADILELLEAARRHVDSVGVTTNGLLVDDDGAAFLARNRIPAAVSLDGPPEVNDYVRGRGNFERTVEAVRRLVAAGVAVNIQTVVSRRSLPFLADMARLAASLGVRLIAFQRLMPFGRGARSAGDLLTTEDARRAAEEYARLVAAHSHGPLRIKTKDPLHYTLLPPRDGAQLAAGAVTGGCRAGLSALFVEGDGTALACPFIRVPAGNLLAQSLEQVWLESRVLRAFRSRSNYVACRDCTHWPRCRGCRAYALEAAGDLMGTDPLCWHSLAGDRRREPA